VSIHACEINIFTTGAQGDIGLAGPPGSPGGITYNRWGRSTCRSGVELLYAGRTGSTLNGNQGGAANYVCMPDDPEYTLPFQAGVQGSNYVYGTEYEGPPLVANREQHNAPCAVCYIPTRHSVIMIPAKTQWVDQGVLWLPHVRTCVLQSYHV
jgi:hypothetical protein